MSLRQLHGQTMAERDAARADLAAAVALLRDTGIGMRRRSILFMG